MKRGKLIVIIGVIIVATLLLCKKPNNLYTINKFYSPDKLIQAFDNNLLYTGDHTRHSTDLLNSMISRRKRLSESGIEFDEMHIEKLEQLSDKRKEEILSDYKNKLKNVPKYHPEGEFIPISFEGIGRRNFYSYNNSNKPKVTDYYDSNIKVDAVIIQENGSYVFDYFWITTLENHD